MMEKFVAGNEAFKQEMRQHIHGNERYDNEEKEVGYDQHEGDGEEVTFKNTDEMAEGGGKLGFAARFAYQEYGPAIPNDTAGGQALVCIRGLQRSAS